MQVIAIVLGGAMGAVMRFWTSTAMYALLGREFPWGTLAVNVLGSLAMGFSPQKYSMKSIVIQEKRLKQAREKEKQRR